MSVVGRDLNEGPRRSHLVTARRLAQGQPLILRLIAIGLWLLSTFGNALAFGVTWPPSLAALVSGPVWIAIGWQVLISAVQAIFCDRWYGPVYLLALAASSIPSFIGYRPLVAVPVAAWLTSTDGAILAPAAYATNPGALWGTVAAYGIVLVGLIAADVVPERILVRH